MNAIPPGGLTPEQPLVRPSAARRGSKAATGTDQVQLMVELEEDPADAPNAIMLEDHDDTPEAHQPLLAEASYGGTGEPMRLEDEPEEAIPGAHSGEQPALAPQSGRGFAAAGVDAGRDAGGDAAGDAAGDAGAPPAGTQQVPPTAGPATPTIDAEPAGKGHRAPRGEDPDFPAAAGPGTAARPDTSVRRESGQPSAAWADDPAFRDEPGFRDEPARRDDPARRDGSPAAHPQPDIRSNDPARAADPGTDADGDAGSGTGYGTGSSTGYSTGSSMGSASARAAPWPSNRGAAEPEAAAATGWDRPPPPPRPAPRATALPTASLGMPAQLTSIEVTLSVEIGSHRLPLRDLLSVEPGQLVPLDRMTSEPVDILVNGKPFARGEVVAIGDRFGVRLTELVDGNDPR